MTTHIRLDREGRKIRFTDFIDDESLAFEAEAKTLLADAALEQRLMYYLHSSEQYFILQIRGEDGKPAMQACVHTGRPKMMPWFAMASVKNLHPAINPKEEEFGLSILRELAEKMPGVMTLRLQPKLYDSSELMAFQARAIRNQFLVSDEQVGTTKTLVLELQSTPEELLAKFNHRTRAKFKHHSRSRVTLCALDDSRYLSACREAANLSRRRSGAGATSDDFESAFILAKAHPERVKIVGLFFNHRPTELLAYVIGFNNGSRVEFYSAGAIHDAELRSIPFNSFLVWELINWARHMGCTQMDMGGVTEGGPNDPLQGVTRFKRGMTENEVETGREMLYLVRPLRHRVYKWLKQLREPKRTSEGLAAIYD